MWQKVHSKIYLLSSQKFIWNWQSNKYEEKLNKNVLWSDKATMKIIQNMGKRLFKIKEVKEN